MSREIVLLREVSHDFVEAFIYYENLSPGRGGGRFEAAFEKALQEVKAGVVTHYRAFEHYHRVFVRGYPYNLYYRLAKDRAVITGLLYARFDPRKLRETLNKRG
jgi:plasmid stabilization system protein ParE